MMASTQQPGCACPGGKPFGPSLLMRYGDHTPPVAILGICFGSSELRFRNSWGVKGWELGVEGLRLGLGVGGLKLG